MAQFEPSAKALSLTAYFLYNTSSPSTAKSIASQLDHRLQLVDFWAITPGARVLEIGCGQGDCTIVLADAVGEGGHVDALDPGAPDYGSSYLFIYSLLDKSVTNYSIFSRRNVLRQGLGSCHLTHTVTLSIGIKERKANNVFVDKDHHIPSPNRIPISSPRPSGLVSLSTTRRQKPTSPLFLRPISRTTS
jgi:hypothetical protein